jgi:hypothetical protein
VIFEILVSDPLSNVGDEKSLLGMLLIFLLELFAVENLLDLNLPTK